MAVLKTIKDILSPIKYSGPYKKKEQTCTYDTDCPEGYVCEKGVCVKKPAPFTPSERAQLPEPPAEEGPRELSREEIAQIARDNPGSSVDLYGNVSPALIGKRGEITEEGKARIHGTEELQAGAGVTSRQRRIDEEAAKQQQEQLRQTFIEVAKGALTDEQLAEIEGAAIDYGQAAGAGLVAVGPSALGTAALARIGGPRAAIFGAIAGATGGFIVAALSNIRGQTTGEFGADKESLTKGITAATAMITLVNDPEVPLSMRMQKIEDFQDILNKIDVAHAKSKRDANEPLNRALGKDGTRELSRFEAFNELGYRQVLIDRFYLAVYNPDPDQAAFSAEELIQMKEVFGEEE